MNGMIIMIFGENICLTPDNLLPWYFLSAQDNYKSISKFKTKFTVLHCGLFGYFCKWRCTIMYVDYNNKYPTDIMKNTIKDL